MSRWPQRSHGGDLLASLLRASAGHGGGHGRARARRALVRKASELFNTSMHRTNDSHNEPYGTRLSQTCSQIRTRSEGGGSHITPAAQKQRHLSVDNATHLPFPCPCPSLCPCACVHVIDEPACPRAPWRGSGLWSPTPLWHAPTTYSSSPQADGLPARDCAS